MNGFPENMGKSLLLFPIYFFLGIKKLDFDINKAYSMVV